MFSHFVPILLLAFLLLAPLSQAQDQPTLPPNPNRLVGTAESFGDAFDAERTSSVTQSFSFSESLPSTASYDTLDVQRDIIVKFTTRYAASSGGALNRTFVRVNGVQRVVTPYSNSTSEVQHSYIFSSRNLRLGSNTIEFRPGLTSSAKLWGIKDISIEYIEPITLELGEQVNTRFGYNQSPTRFTGLRANFELPTTGFDYGLSVVGWDIDNANELQVFINGNSLGFLSPRSGGLNSGDVLFLDREMLEQGQNQIEFVNRLQGSVTTAFAEWGVQELSIDLLQPDLIATRLEITQKVLSASKPFPVSVGVRNRGQTVSDATTIRFYVSNDQTITSSDTQIAMFDVPELERGASTFIDQNVQTNLVNQGLFLGACVDSVTNESDTQNNCSNVLELQGNATVSPVIMLLLDDE